MVIYGIHPVMLFIKHRPKLIRKIYLYKQSKISIDTELMPKTKIQLVTSPKELSYITKTEEHQGICAEIEHFPYAEANFEGLKTVCILDHIEDPRNLGAIIRNAAAFHIDCIIIPKNRSCEVTPTAIKASAGTAAFQPICRVGNINQTIKELKDLGFWVYGFEADGKDKLGNVNFDEKTAFVLGSEGRGISHLTKSLCDFIVSVEMTSIASSLNVSSCSAIVFYKRYLQCSKHLL